LSLLQINEMLVTFDSLKKLIAGWIDFKIEIAQVNIGNAEGIFGVMAAQKKKYGHSCKNKTDRNSIYIDLP
jgi:hypothetical protein